MSSMRSAARVMLRCALAAGGPRMVAAVEAAIQAGGVPVLRVALGAGGSALVLAIDGQPGERIELLSLTGEHPRLGRHVVLIGHLRQVIQGLIVVFSGHRELRAQEPVQGRRLAQPRQSSQGGVDAFVSLRHEVLLGLRPEGVRVRWPGLHRPKAQVSNNQGDCGQA